MIYGAGIVHFREWINLPAYTFGGGIYSFGHGDRVRGRAQCVLSKKVKVTANPFPRGWCSAQRIQNPMIAGGNHTLIPSCQKTLFSLENVGAIIDRPPKNVVFRIFRRKITVFFALRRWIFLWQNPRAIHDRPYGCFL